MFLKVTNESKNFQNSRMFFKVIYELKSHYKYLMRNFWQKMMENCENLKSFTK